MHRLGAAGTRSLLPVLELVLVLLRGVVKEVEKPYLSIAKEHTASQHVNPMAVLSLLWLSG